MSIIENTLFVGRHIAHLTTVESTNTYAIDIISKSKPPEGTVITAYEQTRGRGQIGSYWESEPGKNLTFSVILYPHFLPIKRQFSLTQCLSLGIIDALQPYIPYRLALKWPNDIYVNDKKIGGILLQNSLHRSRLKYSVAGFGINVNQQVFHSEAPNPVSVRQLTGENISLDNLLNVICQALEARYLQLRAEAFDDIKRAYLSFLYRYMADSMFNRPDGSVFAGRIIDVRPDGKLVVLHKGGEEAFGMKEIGFVH